MTRAEHSRPGIYGIVCLVDGKRYVGSAVNLYQRWATHKNRLNDGVHHCKNLQEIWTGLGEAGFEFQVLELCDREELLFKEQELLDEMFGKPWCLNLNPIAASRLGTKASEETRRKMSKAHKGRIVSEESRRKISQSHVGLKSNLSPEQEAARRAKISANSAMLKLTKLISPSGEIVEVRNLTEFARSTPGFTRSGLGSIIDGSRPTYKGWRLAA